jgi:copper(I)-binding protein
MLRLLRAAAAATLLLITPVFAHNGVIHLGPINISAPFSRASLPNAPVGGGYLTIENTGTEPDRLVSASSLAASDTQIHEMGMEGDVMKMRRLPVGLVIAPGETVTLAPGGLHIMLMGLKSPLKEGDTLTITLTFEKAGSVEVPLPILGAAAKTAPHGMDH